MLFNHVGVGLFETYTAQQLLLNHCCIMSFYLQIKTCGKIRHVQNVKHVEGATSFESSQTKVLVK